MRFYPCSICKKPVGTMVSKPTLRCSDPKCSKREGHYTEKEFYSKIKKLTRGY